jgi:hypothetical protein
MVRPPIEAALRCRLPGIEKLGNGGDKLGRRKPAWSKGYCWELLRAPIVCTVAGHVDDGAPRGAALGRHATSSVRSATFGTAQHSDPQVLRRRL